MNICIYVFMYICIYVCMYVCMYVYMYICKAYKILDYIWLHRIASYSVYVTFFYNLLCRAYFTFYVQRINPLSLSGPSLQLFRQPQRNAGSTEESVQSAAGGGGVGKVRKGLGPNR